MKDKEQPARQEGTPVSPEVEVAKLAERVRALQSRLAQLDRELEETRSRAPLEWSRMEKSQEHLPVAGRLTYDSWYATYWGPKISILMTEYSDAAGQLSVLQQRQRRGGNRPCG